MKSAEVNNRHVSYVALSLNFLYDEVFVFVFGVSAQHFPLITCQSFSLDFLLIKFQIL